MPWRKAVALGRQTLDWVEAAVAYRSVVQDDGNQPYLTVGRYFEAKAT